MTPELQVVLSGALTFGIPLLFAIHELRALRRPGPGGDGRDPSPEPPPPRPLPTGQTRPAKPLPDCLIPKLPPRPAPAERRARVPELV